MLRHLLLHNRLKRAVASLRSGGVIAYPTEAVYGLGCDPLNKEAVERLLAIKRRSWQQGMIVIAHTWDSLTPWIADISPDVLARIKREQVMPITWLVPAAPWVPSWIRGIHSTVAMRVTHHPIANALCRTFGTPLVSTSANRHAEPALRLYQEVKAQFKNEIDFIMPGKVGTLVQPTQIRDAITHEIIR